MMFGEFDKRSHRAHDQQFWGQVLLSCVHMNQLREGFNPKDYGEKPPTAKKNVTERRPPAPIRGNDAPDPQDTRVMKMRNEAEGNVVSPTKAVDIVKEYTGVIEPLGADDMDTVTNTLDARLDDQSTVASTRIANAYRTATGRAEANPNAGIMTPAERAKATRGGGNEIVSPKDLGFESSEDLEDSEIGELPTEFMDPIKAKEFRIKARETWLGRELAEAAAKAETAGTEAIAVIDAADKSFYASAKKQAFKGWTAFKSIFEGSRAAVATPAPKERVQPAIVATKPSAMERMASFFGLKKEVTPSAVEEVAEELNDPWFAEGEQTMASVVIEGLANEPELAAVLPTFAAEDMSKDDQEALRLVLGAPKTGFTAWFGKTWRNDEQRAADEAKDAEISNSSLLSQSEKQVVLGSDFAYHTADQINGAFLIARGTPRAMLAGGRDIATHAADFGRDTSKAIAGIAKIIGREVGSLAGTRAVFETIGTNLENRIDEMAAMNRERLLKTESADDKVKFTLQEAEIRTLRREILSVSEQIKATRESQSATLDKAMSERFKLVESYRTAEAGQRELISTQIETANTIINVLKAEANTDDKAAHFIARLQTASKRLNRLLKEAPNANEPYSGSVKGEESVDLRSDDTLLEELELGDVEDSELAGAPAAFVDMSAKPKAKQRNLVKLPRPRRAQENNDRLAAK